MFTSKNKYVKITLINLIKKEKQSIYLQAILQLHVAHLINLKMNENIIEEKTVR